MIQLDATFLASVQKRLDDRGDKFRLAFPTLLGYGIQMIKGCAPNKCGWIK
jgi:hypothetical protein